MPYLYRSLTDHSREKWNPCMPVVLHSLNQPFPVLNQWNIAAHAHCSSRHQRFVGKCVSRNSSFRESRLLPIFKHLPASGHFPSSGPNVGSQWKPIMTCPLPQVTRGRKHYCFACCTQSWYDRSEADSWERSINIEHRVSEDTFFLLYFMYFKIKCILAQANIHCSMAPAVIHIFLLLKIVHQKLLCRAVAAPPLSSLHRTGPSTAYLKTRLQSVQFFSAISTHLKGEVGLMKFYRLYTYTMRHYMALFAAYSNSEGEKRGSAMPSRTVYMVCFCSALWHAM